MAILETLIFDGLSLNTTTPLMLDELSMTPPKAQQEWAKSNDADGSALIRDPLYENRTITGKLRVDPQSTPDLAFTQLALFRGKIEEAERQADGLALVWTPANSTRSLTFYVLTGEITDMPISMTGDGSGWFVNSPVITFSLTCKPFGYGTALATMTDAFGSNTLANYTFDAGAASNLAVSSGVLTVTANPTVTERFYDTAQVAYNTYDAQVTVKATVGTTVASFAAGVMPKRVSVTDRIEVYVDDNGTNSRLRIDVSGTNRSTSNLAARITTSTAFWVRGRVEGSTVYAEYWTAAPTATGSPTLSASYVLAGGEVTLLGIGVAGRTGLTWTPQQTAATLDDFVVEPNVGVSTDVAVVQTVPGVPGDVPADGRLIVTDRATQDRGYVEWGLEHRYTDTTQPLFIGTPALTGTGFAGAATTRAGSYSTNVYRVTLTTTGVTICGNATQAHVGSFRVRARVYASASTGRVRLSWQEGNGPFRSNAYVTPPVAAGWSDVDLGTVTIPAATQGTQRWSLRVDAYSTVGGDTLDVDEITLVPIEAYGRSRAVAVTTASVFAAADQFNQVAGALTGKTLDVGGTWTGAGSATDFQATGTTATRTASADTVGSPSNGRLVVASTSSLTDTSASVTVTFGANVYSGIVARYTDVNNFFAGYLLFAGSTAYQVWYVSRVAGVDTAVNAGTTPTTSLGPYTLGLTVSRAGTFAISLGGVVLTTATLATLASGGALATGKVGLLDWSPLGGSGTRTYDNFIAYNNAPDAPLYSGRQTEFRWDQHTRQDSSGVYYGPPPSFRGGAFRLPPAGSPNRTSRVLTRADRNDLQTAAATTIGDRLQTQVLWTPRYVDVPHS